LFRVTGFQRRFLELPAEFSAHCCFGHLVVAASDGVGFSLCRVHAAFYHQFCCVLELVAGEWAFTLDRTGGLQCHAIFSLRLWVSAHLRGHTTTTSAENSARRCAHKCTNEATTTVTTSRPAPSLRRTLRQRPRQHRLRRPPRPQRRRQHCFCNQLRRGLETFPYVTKCRLAFMKRVKRFLT